MNGLRYSLKQVQAYNPNANIMVIESAYQLAQEAHKNQKRADGTPYILHPVAVANLLITKKLDDFSIIVALLHDTVEDTSVSLDDIRKKFGNNIATLVEGVTKLSNFGFMNPQNKQAENFRGLLLATSRDIRVLLIKLADRLHNMRTIQYLPFESQKRIAFETLEIYVPLAQRIGLRDWKEELEDISFRITNIRAYNSIVKRLESISLQEDTVERIITILNNCFQAHCLKIEISGRQKTPASIWRKLQRKRRFHRLSDIIAFRILTNTTSECYQALGIIHQNFQMVPGGFKDYISLPKSNGYKSIHTLVLLADGQQVEVQIRTQDMHHHAEFGVAAHWKYKEHAPITMKTEGRKYQWIRSLLDILEQATTPEDFLENTKMDLYNSHVFVFSPRGEILDLPAGATPIDYAYTIHSDIGNHCKTARINGHLAPITSRLRNGDQVDIITSRNQFPTQEWLKYTKTGRARTAIRRYLRHANHKEYIRKGTEFLETAYTNAEVKFQKQLLENALDYFNQDNIDNLLALVGNGDIAATDILYHLLPETKTQSITAKSAKLTKTQTTPILSPIENIDQNISLKMAGCCHPLPNDVIIGIVSMGRGITVHKKECHDVSHLLLDDEQETNILSLKWRKEAVNMNFTSRCWLAMENRPNVLATVTALVGQEGANIVHISSNKRDSDLFTCTMDIEINSAEHLKKILQLLQSLPIIHDAKRI